MKLEDIKKGQLISGIDDSTEVSVDMIRPDTQNLVYRYSANQLLEKFLFSCNEAQNKNHSEKGKIVEISIESILLE